jgi:TPR repeat protein
MKKSMAISILALLLPFGLFPSLSVGDEQTKERDDVALEIMTVEVMVDQLEKMPRVTDDERNAWAGLSMDIKYKWFEKIITYETSDNLTLWKLLGRWATADGISEKSPHANAPFFHIQRLRPDYQKDEELLRLMAKLNAIRNKEYQDMEIDGYRKFVFLFEHSNTNLPNRQLDIARAYDEGYGLWRNGEEAVKWYRRAADAGNADALGELGHKYLIGLGGLEMNEDTGVKLLNKAVMKGSASAAYELGQYYLPDHYKAKNWKRKSDRKKAIELFKVAAERGTTKALIAIAREYVKIGNGKEAVRWANGGDEPDPENKKEHRHWEMSRSIADSQGRCSYIKGEVYALGIGKIEQDLVRAKELFMESYRKGRPKGAQAIAAMYRKGIGVEANSILAEQWKNNAIKVFSFASRDWHESGIIVFSKRLMETSKH